MIGFCLWQPHNDPKREGKSGKVPRERSQGCKQDTGDGCPFMRLFGLRLALELPLGSVSFCHYHKIPSIISLERKKINFGI